MGTCAMKPREQGGVVDARLNVYGVQNLKIAGNYPTILCFILISDPFRSDLSIAPGNVGANTYNTAIAIGEKAAVIIAEDLGIKDATSERT
jgi:alcohol oxidase